MKTKGSRFDGYRSVVKQLLTDQQRRPSYIPVRLRAAGAVFILFI